MENEFWETYKLNVLLCTHEWFFHFFFFSVEKHLKFIIKAFSSTMYSIVSQCAKNSNCWEGILLVVQMHLRTCFTISHLTRQFILRLVQKKFETTGCSCQGKSPWRSSVSPKKQQLATQFTKINKEGISGITNAPPWNHIVGNGFSNMSSNPGWGCLHFTQC